MQGSRGRVKVDNEDENGEGGGKEDAPKSCVDMSQCLLRWDAKSKNRSVHLVYHKSRFKYLIGTIQYSKKNQTLEVRSLLKPTSTTSGGKLPPPTSFELVVELRLQDRNETSEWFWSLAQAAREVDPDSAAAAREISPDPKYLQHMLIRHDHVS